jgi:hypothetical protein
VITHQEQSESGKPPSSAGYVAKAPTLKTLGKQTTLSLAIVQVHCWVRIEAAMPVVATEKANDPPGIPKGGVKL